MNELAEKSIGFLGVGRMGKRMAENLLKAGYQVFFFDQYAPAMEDFTRLGGIPLTSPADVAANCKVVFTSLPTPSALREAITGELGILSAIQNESVIVDLSSVDPKTAVEMADLLKGKGAHLLDCPVSGGVTGAERGTLTIMVGGEETVFESVKQELEVIGQNILYIGQTGMGQFVKICHQSLVAITTVALGEAFLTGAKAGLPLDKLHTVLSTGVARSGVLELFGENIKNGTPDQVLFALDLMLKDLRLYVDAADQVETPSRLAKLALNYYESAQQETKGVIDQTVVCSFLEMADEQFESTTSKELHKATI